MENESGSCMYLNSGDWIENLTALEYNHGKWTLYKYQEDAVVREIDLSQYHLEVQGQIVLQAKRLDETRRFVVNSKQELD